MQQKKQTRTIPSIFQMPSRRNLNRKSSYSQQKLNSSTQPKSNNKKSERSGISIPLLSEFKDETGSYDLEKIMSATQQVNQIYTKVSPLISSFRKK